MLTNLQRPQGLFAQPVRYEIPIFQRRYVWKQAEQWEPLWEDVERLAESILEDGHTEPHFMGAVVLQQTPVPAGTIDRRIVVDGQQRLTTLQLLIDAVQEVLEDRDHAAPAMRLAALVLNREEFCDGNPDHAFKVWPTLVDRTAFRHAMNNELSADDFATSRIVQAHEYFKGQAARWLDRVSDDRTALDRAASALENAVRVSLELVVIDLASADDPHVIFETLNARGTPLLQSDMVKNKILHDANVRTEDYTGTSSEHQKLWSFDEDDWWAQAVGRGLHRRPRIDVYLNDWLTLCNRRETRANNEFRVFARYADTQQKAGKTIAQIAKSMRDVGKIYRDIEQIRRADIARFLERRNVMNVGAVTPLLLWLLSAGVPSTTLENCVKALESFLVRRAVCGYGARSYGKLFVDLIARLSTASPDDADRILIRILAEQTAHGTLWPHDKELRERFVTAPLYQWLTQGRLRMVLAGVEEQLRTESKAETTKVPPNLHIEHIMPRTWQPTWPLPEDANSEAIIHRERVIHTIGNLTLLNGRLNASLSNGPWDSKRDGLAEHSVLFLNKRLVNKGPQVWNEAEIEMRAEWLHSKAVKIWPDHDDIAPA